MIPEPEDTFSMPSSHVALDQVDLAFDDERSVASAGLLLPATLAERLGIEQVTDQVVDLGERPGAAYPGRKLLTLIHAMIAGGDCIDDVELLRTGSTTGVLGHRVMAASTVGTFLRSFAFGHVRQLDQVAATILGRAWAAGAGPDDGPLTVDVGLHHLRGARLPQTGRLLRLHPPARLPPAAGHPRLKRRGAACPAAQRQRQHRPRHPAVLRRAGGRCRRAGASGELTFRMDSGFWSAKLIKRLRRHRVRYSITVRQTKTVRAAIVAIPEPAWVPIGLPARWGRPGRRDRLSERPADRAPRAERR
jgi:hypothetical protein